MNEQSTKTAAREDMEIMVVEPPKNVVAISDSDKMFSLIERALTDNSITPEKLHGLLDFKERLDAKSAEFEANAAFARVIKNMPVIKKNGLIDFQKKDVKPIPYAKFEDIQEVIRPIYEAEGFVVNYDSEPLDNSWTRWTAIAAHTNGVRFKASISLPLDTSGGKQNIQGSGSTAQYGKRYSTSALFNLRFEGEDDDGVRGGMTFIPMEKVKIINALLDSTKADIARFFQYMEIAEVENIQNKDYAKALNALGTKIVKEKEKEAAK